MAKPRAAWNHDDYQREIKSHRDKAKSLRRRADVHDLAADKLREEAAKLATLNLPMFQ